MLLILNFNINTPARAGEINFEIVRTPWNWELYFCNSSFSNKAGVMTENPVWKSVENKGSKNAMT